MHLRPPRLVGGDRPVIGKSLHNPAGWTFVGMSRDSDLKLILEQVAEDVAELKTSWTDTAERLERRIADLEKTVAAEDFDHSVEHSHLKHDQEHGRVNLGSASGGESTPSFSSVHT